MRKLTGIYWILTGLAAAFILLASIPDVLQVPAAVDIFKHLGFPPYLLPFIGLANHRFGQNLGRDCDSSSRISET